MTSYLPSAIKQPIANGADFVRGAVGSVTWGPVLTVSKAAVTSLLRRIETGTLVINDATGEQTVYGERLAKEFSKHTNSVNGTMMKSKKVELTVKKEAFWIRLFLFADMGFAESFMLGEVDGDLVAFFQVISCTAYSTKDRS